MRARVRTIPFAHRRGVRGDADEGYGWRGRELALDVDVGGWNSQNVRRRVRVIRRAGDGVGGVRGRITSRRARWFIGARERGGDVDGGYGGGDGFTTSRGRVQPPGG